MKLYCTLPKMGFSVNNTNTIKYNEWKSVTLFLFQKLVKNLYFKIFLKFN